MWEPSGDQLGRFLWGITVVSPEPEGCICSDHAADLGFVPSARHGHAPLAYDLTGSTSGQSARLAIQVLETQEPGVEGVKGAFIQIMPLTWDSFPFARHEQAPLAYDL